jgi:hypothetical protein
MQVRALLFINRARHAQTSNISVSATHSNSGITNEFDHFFGVQRESSGSARHLCKRHLTYNAIAMHCVLSSIDDPPMTGQHNKLLEQDTISSWINTIQYKRHRCIRTEAKSSNSVALLCFSSYEFLRTEVSTPRPSHTGKHINRHSFVRVPQVRPSIHRDRRPATTATTAQSVHTVQLPDI